jgi:hypothetical protein
MNDRTRVVRRPWWAWAPAARTAVAIIATAGLALLAAACGGSPGSHVAQLGSTTTQPASSSGSSNAELAPSSQVLAYSHCMRSHGVSSFPDPNSSEEFDKAKVAAASSKVGSSRFQAAQTACRPVLPTSGSLQQREDQCIQNKYCPPALLQQMLNADRKLAQCMRSHGVSNFPDPTSDPSGPWFNYTKAGISDAASHTRQFIAKLDECGPAS